MKILSVTLERRYDESPDTSWLGEYTDVLAPGVIVRALGEYYEKLPENADIPGRGREYRGFKPYAGGEQVGTEDFYKYGMQDFERMERLRRGDWYFLGIAAKARIQLSGDIVQTIHSGGLWGIESDSDAVFLAEIEQEELASLRRELGAIGFSAGEIDAAIADLENVPEF